MNLPIEKTKQLCGPIGSGTGGVGIGPGAPLGPATSILAGWNTACAWLQSGGLACWGSGRRCPGWRWRRSWCWHHPDASQPFFFVVSASSIRLAVRATVGLTSRLCEMCLRSNCDSVRIRFIDDETGVFGLHTSALRVP